MNDNTESNCLALSYQLVTLSIKSLHLNYNYYQSPCVNSAFKQTEEGLGSMGAHLEENLITDLY